MESDRSRKIGEQIQQALAQILLREVKDPRVQWVTISSVRVSKDLQNAKIFFTIMGDEENAREEALQVLQKISGFLRHNLGRQLRLRVLPQLYFVYDDSIERGNRLSRAIEEAVASDKKKIEGAG